MHQDCEQKQRIERHWTGTLTADGFHRLAYLLIQEANQLKGSNSANK